MSSAKLLSDIVCGIIVGDIITPYKIDNLSFYHTGDKITIYYGNTQIVELMMNEGGTVGNIDGDDLTPLEKSIIDLFKGIFGIDDNDPVSIIPISKLRQLVNRYTTRYSYDSTLASLYKFYDSSKISDINTLYDDWLEEENNPVLVPICYYQ